MRILTFTNYDLPSEYSAILFKTLGESVAIGDWATVRHETFDKDTILIIFKKCEDLSEYFYMNPAIITSKTILISEDFSLRSIYQLTEYNLRSFIDYNDLSCVILETAIAACRNDSLFLSKTILAELKNEPSTGREIVRLTRRETEILKLIYEGLTSDEIASRLFLSKRTVDTHRGNILQKLDVKNNTGLIKAAIQRQLIDIY